MFYRRYARPVGLVVMSAAVGLCNQSGYQERQLGEQIELVSSQHSSLGVMPDVVFYDVVGSEVYGVRRMGDPASTQGGYWAKCRLFLATPEAVRYFDADDMVALESESNFAEPVSFAKEKCLNFGARRDTI